MRCVAIGLASSSLAVIIKNGPLVQLVRHCRLKSGRPKGHYRFDSDMGYNSEIEIRPIGEIGKRARSRAWCPKGRRSSSLLLCT